MSKKLSKLEEVKIKLQAKIKEAEDLNTELGFFNYALYNDLKIIQSQVDDIRHVPHDEVLKYKWSKNACDKYYTAIKEVVEKYDNNIKVETSGGMAAVGIGAGVATLGPTAAMGFATTFGVASTGTAISSLSGAAASNAALAWLGGGALAANGGGMAAGSALLALAGPVGWTIAGLAFAGSGILFWKTKKDKDAIEKLFLLINERDQKDYDSAIKDMKERLIRVKKDIEILNAAIKQIGTFGTDYQSMTERQQYSLGSFYNQMKGSSELLLKPIAGIQPKFNTYNIAVFFDRHAELKEKYLSKIELIVYFTNLLYLINTTDNDLKLLAKIYSKNKDFCKAMKVEDKEIISFELLNVVQTILKEG